MAQQLTGFWSKEFLNIYALWCVVFPLLLRIQSTCISNAFRKIYYSQFCIGILCPLLHLPRSHDDDPVKTLIDYQFACQSQNGIRTGHRLSYSQVTPIMDSVLQQPYHKPEKWIEEVLQRNSLSLERQDFFETQSCVVRNKLRTIIYIGINQDIILNT